MSYEQFIDAKRTMATDSGFAIDGDINPSLFDFQRDIVRWALRRGRASIFADCGMGKTIMQLAWADAVADHTCGRVIILAPLAVAAQTAREAERFGIDAAYIRDDDGSRIVVTNYEMLNRFDPDDFHGVVLDESSILKAYTGKIRTEIIESFERTPYKLACTATPSPNDHMELGNHAEFMGVMTRPEMLAMYFVHDGGETQKWRLKGHAADAFWQWVCSWAVMVRSPADLGYESEGFDLPPIEYIDSVVDVSATHATDGELFAADALSLSERQQARRATVAERVDKVAAIVATKPDEPWIVWCNLNSESQLATDAIDGAVEITGSDKPEKKESAMLGFADGDVRVLVTKPRIAGFGMNWQHCANVVFLGLSDSYEQFYQATRRCWRFGQTRTVNVHVVTASNEGAVVRNIRRKEADATTLGDEMSKYTAATVEGNITSAVRDSAEYNRDIAKGESWEMHLGDCVDVVSELETGSIDYTIFSPPFASLYTYSNSDRDMGNVKDMEEFAEHFKFLVPELLRVTRPGRLLSFHCMNLPSSKVRDGHIGLKDFRGELVRMFTDAGWIFHSEVCIWKDPVTAMQRTKAIGLLYKQLRKDSSLSRQGIPDYLVTMRAPGENTKRIEHTHDSFPVDYWQRYASPVWMDINPGNTLQKQSARDDKDERHICPLQLDVIERALDLWSTEGDTVLSPFGGIGSEGYCAVRKGRKFIGSELKSSYHKQAVANLKEASGETIRQLSMFA
jgi:DNA modification methylase